MTLQVVSFFVLALPGGLLALAGGCPATNNDNEHTKELDVILLCGLAMLSAGLIIDVTT
jgi:hypothetical protein